LPLPLNPLPFSFWRFTLTIGTQGFFSFLFIIPCQSVDFFFFMPPQAATFCSPQKCAGFLEVSLLCFLFPVQQFFSPKLYFSSFPFPLSGSPTCKKVFCVCLTLWTLPSYQPVCTCEVGPLPGAPPFFPSTLVPIHPQSRSRLKPGSGVPPPPKIPIYFFSKVSAYASPPSNSTCVSRFFFFPFCFGLPPPDIRLCKGGSECFRQSVSEQCNVRFFFSQLCRDVARKIFYRLVHFLFPRPVCFLLAGIPIGSSRL